ncbi:HAD family hydrolase [Parasedimentitalea psychrophila]|uniref:phosphoglycolate phosphatase n=1 Tax=Parasedimentitalea psychrophila TaxID=2997337 RepID=A0A9Y2KYQ6_9RHOB|nr:HAD family hydrolase [Parasedimentitalea psychrophila]WIY25586.1 HAD family hydrolase [Parasedimentitalea psychrophila]
MPVDALLFDKDGTLFDFAATWNVWTETLIRDLSQGQEETAQALAKVLGYDLDAGSFYPDSIAIACANTEIAAAIAPLIDHMDQAAIEQHLALSAATAPLAEAVPLAAFLDDLLARGKVLGVMTNDAEFSARSQLQRTGVLGHFAFVAGYDSGHGAKPDPDPLLAFCKAVGVDPARTAMVGDSCHDLEAGRAAGMRRIGVLTGLAQRGDLAPLADVVLPDIGHIPAWLDG